MGNIWPSQSSVLAGTSIYGNPRGRNGLASATWESKNLVYVKPPFAMYFAGVKLTRGCKVHRACSESFARVLANLRDAVGGRQEELDFAGVSVWGGGHTFRLMRGTNSLSMHSYGCAVDLDPARNGLYDRTPRFAEFPWVLAAFRAEGWRWGGDWNGNGSSADERKADGMHWQATR